MAFIHLVFLNKIFANSENWRVELEVSYSIAGYPQCMVFRITLSNLDSYPNWGINI